VIVATSSTFSNSAVGGFNARTLGLLLWVAAVTIAWLAATQFDELTASRAQADSAASQLTKAQAVQARSAAAIPSATLTPETAFMSDAKQLGQLQAATRAHSSEARNYLSLLTLVRKACDASGLRECQVTRGSVPALAQAAAPLATASQTESIALSEYAIKLIGNIDQSGGWAAFDELDKSGRVYRVSRVSIASRRVEIDLLFWLDDKAQLAALKDRRP
jgi:hypothetical protein